jgi:hypothetical protein
MSVLSAPHPFNQDAPGNRNATHDCGESCVASVLYDNGDTSITVNKVQDLIGHGGDTDPADLIEALHERSVPAHEVTGGMSTYVNGALSRSHRVFAAIWSDHSGNPKPGSGLGHWIEVYGHDGAGYHCMNPVGGRIVTYASNVLEPASQDIGVEVDVVLPVDRQDQAALLLLVGGGC